MTEIGLRLCFSDRRGFRLIAEDPVIVKEMFVNADTIIEDDARILMIINQSQLGLIHSIGTPVRSEPAYCWAKFRWLNMERSSQSSGSAMEFDAENTPYLRLAPPHNAITLATYRPADAPILISMLNHPAVYMNLAGPPFPYLQQHHDSKIKDLEVETEQALKEHREFKRGGEEKLWVSAVPFTVIREMDHNTGEDTAIGDLVFRRSDFLDIQDKVERMMVKSENDARLPGDPETIWEIGFSLVPTVHGRGIMTAVLDALTNNWLVPYMNVHHMSGSYLEHNPATRRVFEKCGWTFSKFVPDCVELPVAMTGSSAKKIGMGVMKWDR